MASETIRRQSASVPRNLRAVGWDGCAATTRPWPACRQRLTGPLHSRCQHGRGGADAFVVAAVDDQAAAGRQHAQGRRASPSPARPWPWAGAAARDRTGRRAATARRAARRRDGGSTATEAMPRAASRAGSAARLVGKQDPAAPIDGVEAAPDQGVRGGLGIARPAAHCRLAASGSRSASIETAAMAGQAASAFLIFSALAASTSGFSILPVCGPSVTPSHRGSTWKCRWNTTCPPAGSLNC